ncbi:YfiR family protein [Catalinimonas alkaloidigena]|nr:YfiR family protein [Catalinimonas alkaloidigena]
MLLRTILVLFFCASGFWSCHAQSTRDFRAAERRVQSIFISNFTRYIQWPEGANQGTFCIGFLGTNHLQQEVEAMAKTKTVNGRPMRVAQYGQPGEIPEQCHMLIISPENSHQLAEVLRRTRGKPMLIVTQKDGLGKAGSLINFISIDGQPTFEVNVGALEQNQLRCAQQLLRQAVLP